jgi:hypothetical protein
MSDLLEALRQYRHNNSDDFVFVFGYDKEIIDRQFESIRADTRHGVLRSSGLHHEIWAAAQLLPGEGIADAVRRIGYLIEEALTGRSAQDEKDKAEYKMICDEPGCTDAVKWGFRTKAGAHRSTCQKHWQEFRG